MKKLAFAVLLFATPALAAVPAPKAVHRIPAAIAGGADAAL